MEVSKDTAEALDRVEEAERAVICAAMAWRGLAYCQDGAGEDLADAVDALREAQGALVSALRENPIEATARSEGEQ